MPDLGISQLPVAVALTGAELLELVQGGANVQGTVNSIRSYLDGRYWRLDDPNSQVVTAALGFISNADLGYQIVLASNKSTGFAKHGAVVVTQGVAYLYAEDGDIEMFWQTDAQQGIKGLITNIAGNTSQFDQTVSQFLMQVQFGGFDTTVSQINNLWSVTGVNGDFSGELRVGWQTLESEYLNATGERSIITQNATLWQAFAQDAALDATAYFNVQQESIDLRSRYIVSTPNLDSWFHVTPAKIWAEIIDSDGFLTYSLEIEDGQGVFGRLVESTGPESWSFGATITDGAFLRYTDAFDETNVWVSAAGVQIDSANPGFQGARYGADYSANYVGLSLIHRAYAEQLARTSFTFVVGDSVAVSTGGKPRARFVSPIKGTIVSWKIILDQAATVTLDIWKKFGAIPTNADSITASAKPETTASAYAVGASLTGWTQSIDYNDVFQLEVEANDLAQSITLELVIIPSI